MSITLGGHEAGRGGIGAFFKKNFTKCSLSFSMLMIEITLKNIFLNLYFKQVKVL